MSDWRRIAAVAVGAMLFTGWVWRFLPYTQRERGAPSFWWFAAVALAAGFALAAGPKPPAFNPAHWIVGGLFTCNALLISYDWTNDPTDHNLFPFEFLILGFCASPAYLGAWLARRFSRG